MATIDLLRSLGADAVEHFGGSLLEHLVRVHDLLGSWDQPEDVRLAGLCHAAYGTDGFPVALLPLDDRATLRAEVGAAAERLVHDYGTCDRRATYARLGARPLPMTSRLTGETRDLTDAAAAAFAAVTIANELDVVRHAGPVPVVEITALTRALAPYAPTPAHHALAALAALPAAEEPERGGTPPA